MNTTATKSDSLRMVDLDAPFTKDASGEMDQSMTTATYTSSTYYTSQMEEDEDYPKSMQEELIFVDFVHCSK